MSKCRFCNMKVVQGKVDHKENFDCIRKLIEINYLRCIKE